MKYTIKWESNGKKASIIWVKYEHQFPKYSPYDQFCCIFPYYGKCMGKNDPYYVKSMSTNFSVSPHTKGFVAFSRTIRNWWGNPCISHMLKYTTEWESDWKKAPILWEEYDYWFPRLSPYHVFCCNFSYCEKCMGKPMHFPYDDIG